MNPETARWLLEGVNLFLKNPQLPEWNYLPRNYFLAFLKETLRVEKDLSEIEALGVAKNILGKIILEELTAPNIPSELEFWHQELEEAEEQKREIRKEVLERVRAQIRTWQTQARPILPLAGPITKGVSQEAPPGTPKPEEPLPAEITEKLAAEDEGVALAPIFTLLQPKVAASVIKKAVLAAPVKILQVLDKISGEELTGETVSEWREMLHQGLTSKDLEASVLTYQEAGISPEHPVVKNLEAKRTRVKAYEQNHPLISGILKHYHEFSKITGRRQIFLPEIKTFLPRLAQAPAWVKKQGYSWRLRQGLNQLGFVFQTHEKVVLGPGKTVVKFTLPDKFAQVFTLGKVKSFGTVKSFVYRKTAGAILTRLGKTALGQGIKKAGAWVLTRLGLAAIPTGVTQAMAAALLVKDVLTIAPKFLKWFFKKLWDNPLLVGFLGAGLLLLPLLLALPFLLIPILVVVGAILLGSAILSGAAQIGGAIVSGVGGFLGGVAQTVGGVLSSLSTMSLPGFLTAAGGPVVWGTVGVGVVSFVVIMNTSAAFVEKGGRGDERIDYGQPVPPRPPGQTGHFAEEVISVLNNCGIVYVNRDTWEGMKGAEECLKNSGLPNKEKIIAQFRYSVFNVEGGELQCVGFVRGVMAAFGQDPGAWGNANNYLSVNIPNYQTYLGMDDVGVGDIVVRTNGIYGHMGIVVQRDESYTWIAQAWGGGGGGELEIQRIDNSKLRLPESVFQGFLRPK